MGIPRGTPLTADNLNRYFLAKETDRPQIIENEVLFDTDSGYSVFIGGRPGTEILDPPYIDHTTSAHFWNQQGQYARITAGTNSAGIWVSASSDTTIIGGGTSSTVINLQGRVNIWSTDYSIQQSSNQLHFTSQNGFVFKSAGSNLPDIRVLDSGNSNYIRMYKSGAGYIHTDTGNIVLRPANNDILTIATSGVTLNSGNFYVNSGSVGIGTTSPAHTLDVSGTGRFTGALTLGTQATSTSHAVRADRTITIQGETNVTVTGGTQNLTANRTWTLGWTGQLAVSRGGTGRNSLAEGQILFGAGANAVGLSSNLFWDSAGESLGVGTSLPTEKIEVIGNIKLSGGERYIYFTGGHGYLRTTDSSTYLYFQTSGSSTRMLVHNSYIRNYVRTRHVDGTEESPGIVFHNDTDTGIWRPGNNIMAFSTGGVERLRISDSSIDTTNNLNITGSLSVTGDVSFAGTLQQGTVPWALLSNVPSASTSQAGIVQLNNTTSSTSTTQAATANAVKTLADRTITITGETNVTVSGGTQSLQGNRTWTLGWTGQLAVSRGGTGRNSLTAGQILFGAGTSAVGIDSNLFWDNTNKRLGVGTSSPTGKLHVAGEIISTTRGSRVGQGSTPAGYIEASDFAIFGSHTSTGTIFEVFDGSGTSIIKVLGSTNVGIGTTSPAYKLDVAGDVRFTGTLQGGTVPWARLSGVPSASTSAAGIVQLNNTTTSTSTAQAATANAVKTLADRTITITGETNVTVSGGSQNLQGNRTWTLGWTGQLAVSRGGTGRSSLTAGQILFGAGTSAVGIDSNLYWDNSNKRLGIGTSSPKDYLHISSSGSGTRTRLRLEVTGNSTNQDALVTFSDAGENLHWSIGARDSGDVFTITTSEELDSGVIITINRSGSVGIGTASPSYPLHVSGNIGFTGTLQAGNIPAERITSGSLHVDRIPDLPASKITSGTIAAARLPSASTSAAGIVQLNNTTTSTSTTQAATANAVKILADRTITITGETNVTVSGGSQNLQGNRTWTLGWTGQLAVSRGGTGRNSLTSGQILFGNGTSSVGLDSNLYWNNSNKRLGVGTNSPQEQLHVAGKVRSDEGFKAGPFEIVYNSSSESLDFIFVG